MRENRKLRTAMNPKRRWTPEGEVGVGCDGMRQTQLKNSAAASSSGIITPPSLLDCFAGQAECEEVAVGAAEEEEEDCGDGFDLGGGEAVVVGGV